MSKHDERRLQMRSSLEHIRNECNEVKEHFSPLGGQWNKLNNLAHESFILKRGGMEMTKKYETKQH